MRIGIIGAGNMAAALGAAWAASGRELLVGGRSRERSEAMAARINAAFPAAQWVPVDRPASAATVPLCGDDDAALAIAARLVRDARGIPAILPGGLARARQLEEAAGFVIGLAFSGADPAAAVPHVPVHAG